ncbi:MAG: BrnT family toxin [Gammaproteobacteria bacterium]
MRITCDSAKRERTLIARGLDFEDAAEVFAGLTLEVEDTRRDYGEPRILCVGFLRGRMVMVGYTPRGAVRHVFSMRKCNAREIRRYTPYFGQI